MIKSKRSRSQPIGQNPLSDMEQFYMQQYFNTQPQGSLSQMAQAPSPPYHKQQNQQMSSEQMRLAQLEMRVAHLERYLQTMTAPKREPHL